MPGTFFGLEIGRRGLQVHQTALDVTSHNLTNASTEGYSRQEAVITVTDPYTAPDLNSPVTTGQLGTGIMTSMILRIRDEYLDPMVRSTNTDRYYWEDQIDVLNRVEVSFAEPNSNGIANQLTEFFKNWQNLNNNPQDAGVKASVAETGVQLASLITYTYNQLDGVQESVMKPVTSTPPAVDSGILQDKVNRVNDLLVQIANVTDDIVKIYRVGQKPNDLLDQRDKMLDELARYGPLQVVNGTTDGKPNGEISMTFFNKEISTDPPAHFSLGINDNGSADPDSWHVVLNEDNLGQILDLTAEKDNYAIGGSLLGLESARQDIIRFKNYLNNIAVNLSGKIHEKNSAPPAAALLDFFLGTLKDGNFRVNDAILNNPSVIDGTKAGAISNISTEYMGAGQNYTLEQYYAMLVTDVGNKVSGTNGMASNQQAIQEQMNNLRDSVSGVSVDEELTKMVQFQYGYQASSRVVNMMDEILNEVINKLKQL